MREETGRKELNWLSETGGREERVEKEGRVIFYKPIWVQLKSQRQGQEIGSKGNMVSVVRGERREVCVRTATPAKEINRLVNVGVVKQGKGDEEAFAVTESQWRRSIALLGR